MCLRLLGQSLRFERSSQNAHENGNVFMAIFGAIALVGLLGASIMTFMKGPLSTSVKLTKMNTAENQMSIGAQVAVMATASQANNGDCELIDPDGAGPLPAVGDGFVEPIEWRTPSGSEPIPTGGGLVPQTLGISKKDPWGTEYGYCVWNHGPSTSGNGCNTNMLAGTNSRAYPVVAIISAGPDKAFTTTCRSFAGADVTGDGDLLDPTDLPMVQKAAETDDDIITSFTYDEATGASGGLWSLKSGEPGTAVIGKNIETTGTASLKGGLLLPDKSFVHCDATTAGVMAMNGSAIEICDGTGWEAITGGALSGNGLVISPVQSSAMNVSAVGCATSTCYGTNVVFTLQNNLTVASDVLVTSLSNTTNFQFVSNNCNVSLAAGASCQMVVRARASGNVSYTGTLNVIGNNSPFATMDGIASNFPGCNVGGQAPGGYYVACGVGTGYNIITTPSGCGPGTTNPVCAGGADTYTTNNCTRVDGFTTTGSDGAQNTANLLAYSAGTVSFPAVSYCGNLVYGGYDDWFLPSYSEMQAYFYPNRVAINLAAAQYGTSSYTENANYSYTQTFMEADGSSNQRECGRIWRYRCARRDPVVTITPTPDNAPISFSFNPSYGNAAETRTSTSGTIYGVTAPINISVGGGISAKYSINGGAYTSTAGTATNGDTITLQATSPSAGQENVVTLTMGSATATWLVRTPGNNTLRVFTSAATVNGTGVTSANCTSWANAAGLTGSWQTIAAGNGGGLENSLPWNWTRLQNMNGQTIATSVADFMDGTISGSLAYSQTGAPVSGQVWTGYSSGTSYYGNCSGWASTSPYGASADGTATTGGWYIGMNATYNNCTNLFRVYCIETNTAGADLDPADVSIRPQVTFASGGTGVSNTVTITSVTDAVSVTITPSAGTANIIKGGASLGATTTTAGLNETLSFTLTAPTVLGTRNTATINIGPDAYTWWVGYADSAKEAKVFVTSSLPNYLGGLTGADSICASYAAGSNYGLSSKWKAMMSDSSNDMMNRIPWNWGTLKTVTGTTVANGGYPDLMDGSLDTTINITESGGAYSGWVHTGSNMYGAKRNSAGSTDSSYWFNDWTSDVGGCGNAATGGSSVSTSIHFNQGTACYNSGRIYCIEDVDDMTLDTIPSSISLTYPIQVPASSRQVSSNVLIGGMSNGATTTLSVTATAGNPTFTVNGGAEVTSASVQNGDTVVFRLDAPATDNSNNRMTITAGGSTTLGTWRVWTGTGLGSLVKRVFIAQRANWQGNMGGLAGADSTCQSAASSAALGGTWKALLSGQAEAEYAINRIGYNWTKLQGTDGVDIVNAGNIWSTATVPLLAPIVRNAANTTTTNSNAVLTNTQANGSAVFTDNANTCVNWSNAAYSGSIALGTSSVSNSGWLITRYGPQCTNGYNEAIYFYCIEQ